MAKHNDLGREGEAIVAKFLTEKGYEIIDENWTHGKAEVDLIAIHANTLIFIEVKTRSSVAFGQPEDFVSMAKQKMLEGAAQNYIEIMDFNGEIRFDVVAVLMKNNQLIIKHIEDAFWPYA